MLDQSSRTLDDGDLPVAPVDLSARMRELRARAGLKQSEIARRMGLDPSIPSLWEQGKRPVPASRLASLAEALGVNVTDLLRGVADGSDSALSLGDRPARASMLDYAASSRSLRDTFAGLGSPLVTLVSATQAPPTPVTRIVERKPIMPPLEVPPARKPWVPQERPVLEGWVPLGWEPGDRVQDIGPSLPDGYWLDPVRLEKPAARALLRGRLCAEDQAMMESRDDVPGAAMAQRLYLHCAQRESFTTGRLPLVETIFRLVAASEYGGLTVDALVEALQARSGGMPVNRGLLRRLRDSVRGYPLRWVDRELFGR